MKAAVKETADAAKKLNKIIYLVIISTVLPGTIEREIKPLLNPMVILCYNPFFIAMGTTREDFENPEFVLLGCDDVNSAVNEITAFYKTIHDKQVFHTSIKNAELIKVIYNTYISSKIAYINTVMELCEKVGANVDEVSNALSLATDRVVSMKYLRGGNGDGGGCHPRDNIALSWLAREVGLKYDYFEHIMKAREAQAEWFAEIIDKKMKKTRLPLIVLGMAFKKNINLVVGSPILLMEEILREKGISTPEYYDPVIFEDQEFPNKRALYFVGMNHDIFSSLVFPTGSVIIDPWGMIKQQNGVEVISLGRK